MSGPPEQMPPRLLQFLLGGQTCVVATVDEKGLPQTTLMTWAVARNPQTVTMAVDVRGRSYQALRGNP
jgi:flavin reductase (DIM6/NTAB) family NADH-FMN oxidoreductase RutF